ncbi:hypothetical protein [Mycetocola zhujimingii]|uniref:hypothetical protein n=1 Tax=Mycetocola zhujimingii TaxID=2079792 RepID=UPI000D3470B4|nr:hypothetical protein [Mycetocola zhujimingii]AWB87455.1 hypothetical protein C3E77_13145 [Mycetocola zhujimingii]
MLDPDTAEYARWNAAAYRAAGVPDDDVSPRTIRALLRIGALVAVCAALGVALVLARASEEAVRGTALPQLVEQLMFLTLGLLVGVGGFIWARQSGHYLTRDQSISQLLTRADLRQSRRWLRGQEHPDPRWTPTLVALARQKQRTLIGAAPLYAGLVLFEVSAAFATNGPMARTLILLAVLLVGVIAIQSVVEYRRAGRFIAEHRLPHRP